LKTKSATPSRNVVKTDISKPQSCVSDSLHLTAAELSMRKPRTVDFVPYSIKDYNNIKPEGYYELGGLGPSSVGTDDWVKRKEMQERRKEYAKQIVANNSNRLPPSNKRRPERQVEEKLSARQRAIEFAKNIPKPTLKVAVKESLETENKIEPESELDKMQKEHEKLKASVMQIKAQLE
jgi:hypothetical protein